ncbi:M16 family metallopeptidase, partial [Methanocalculus natronophilus]|uniref:M16 family metallopeptidase n=1 Tax=Methanocalculus natronophilus TaxID=1262400 RepID=UPI0031B57DC0
FKAEYSNKTRYAAKRYYELLYKDHPYNINPLGIEEKIDSVTLDDIKNAYESMLKNPTLISVSGNVSEETIKTYVSSFTLSKKPLPKDIFIKHDFTHLNDIKETLELSQDRLFIGLKSGIYYKDDDFFAMSIFNTLLGEGSDSLLFDVVREKHALAYYVHSAYAPFSSLVTIVSGMEKKNIEKAKSLIRETLEHIKNNAFSDETFQLAKQQK